MSEVLLYHYLNEKGPPTVNRVSNASAWISDLVRLFDKERNLLGPDYDYDAVYKPAYNEFQASRAPNWQKIAAGFLSDFTLVLDEDRATITDALYRTFDHVNRGKTATSISATIGKVAIEMSKLDAGPQIVTTSYSDKDRFPTEDRIRIAQFRDALRHYEENPLASDIESLLEDHKVEVAVSIEEVLTRFERGIHVPRFWK